MFQEEKVSLTISIPKPYRDRLRTLAAEQNLNNPDLLTSASTIAREIVCDYVDKLEQRKTAHPSAPVDGGDPV
jgi:hypothetical protein